VVLDARVLAAVNEALAPLLSHDHVRAPDDVQDGQVRREREPALERWRGRRGKEAADGDDD